MITVSGTSTTVPSPQRVRVTGDLDLPSGDELERRVRPMLTPGSQVAIDLRDVEFADSSGLGALLVLNQLAEEQGSSLVLLDPSAAVLSVLELTATSDLFAIAGARQHRRPA